MIFHYPLPLNPNATAASGIRPLRMIDAFKEIGYHVTIIDGYGADRKDKIASLKQQILSGVKFDFLYSESSTQPTLLTEKNHLPKYPLLDFAFMNFCKIHNIKIGLFYRDIYWLFPEYGKDLSFIKKYLAKLFYKYDLIKYNSLVDSIYLPSIHMSKYIHTIPVSKFKTLPPGHNIYNSLPEINNQKDTINLLYIGGLGSHYQMHKLFKALKNFKQINFTLCTRKKEWENIKDEYKLLNNINIVHKSGKELNELYQKTDIAILFVKPQEYREFAAPVKLFEYIGQEKPIIASKGTLAGEFVEKNDIGWNIDYTEVALKTLLTQLINNKDLILMKKKNIKAIKANHTWKARARKVQEDLIS